MITILPGGQPGHLDGERVHVRYSDGCVTSFPVGQEVTLERAFLAHRDIHAVRESIVCFDYPNCDLPHAGGAGGVAVHPPAGARNSGTDSPLIPDEGEE